MCCFRKNKKTKIPLCTCPAEWEAQKVKTHSSNFKYAKIRTHAFEF